MATIKLQLHDEILPNDIAAGRGLTSKSSVKKVRVDEVELFAFVHSWKLTRAYKVWYGSESNLIEQNVEQNCNDAGVGKPTYGVLKRKDFLFLTWAII